MLEGLEPWIVQGGAVTLALAAVWAIFTGRLIPGRTHDAIVADKDEQIAAWKAAHESEVARGEVLAEQVGKLLALGDTTVGIVRAIPRAKDTAS